MQRKRVFICSPYAGDVEHNKALAEFLCEQAIEAGLAPFAPHLYLPQILNDNDPGERAIGIDCGLAYLRCCDYFWASSPDGLPTWGMQQEMHAAKKIGLKVSVLTLPEAVLDRIYEREASDV